QPAEIERRLAIAAQAGDRAAFEEIVRRSKAPLYRFVRRYVGDADEAYDILQDAFVAAWLALPRFDGRHAFSVWLRAIALNKCRDHGRRRAVRRRIHMLFCLDSGLWQSGTLDPAAADHREDPRLRLLDQAIAALPRRYKEPLLLTLTAGLTQEQAAVQLQITTKAVEMRIRRARRKLGESLADTTALALEM
ncbi:MAG: RNA polymerase sigma factor, partial [Acidobacteriota bacterium]